MPMHGNRISELREVHRLAADSTLTESDPMGYGGRAVDGLGEALDEIERLRTVLVPAGPSPEEYTLRFCLAGPALGSLFLTALVTVSKEMAQRAGGGALLTQAEVFAMCQELATDFEWRVAEALTRKATGVDPKAPRPIGAP